MRYRLAKQYDRTYPFLGAVPTIEREKLPLIGAGPVRRVNDADGMEIYIDNVMRRVRLAGVDGPELGARDLVMREKARACLEALRAAVGVGPVELRGDPLQAAEDRYGRTIAYVYVVGSGLDVCRDLVERGLAAAWRGGKYTRRQEFKRLELMSKCKTWPAAKA